MLFGVAVGVGVVFREGGVDVAVGLVTAEIIFAPMLYNKVRMSLPEDVRQYGNHRTVEFLPARHGGRMLERWPQEDVAVEESICLPVAIHIAEGERLLTFGYGECCRALQRLPHAVEAEAAA